MAIVGFICVVATPFLLACLRGFRAALKQKYAGWAVLIVSEENAELGFYPPRTLIRELQQSGMRRVA